MDSKDQTLRMLKEEFARWQDLAAGWSQAQVIDRRLPGDLSLKDVFAHLMTWQQRSIARMLAAQTGQEPDLSDWPQDLDPESDADVDAINAWIFATHRDRPWESVYRDWHAGFARLIALGEATPEADLMAAGKYPWLGGYRLVDVLIGSWDHHAVEHYGPLSAWLAGK